jgi:hypothetical protein
MKPTTLLCCAALLSACTANAAPPTGSPQGPAAERLAEARLLLDRDPDAALAIADEVLRDDPDSRDARLLLAEGSLALMRRGTSARTDLLLQDAVRNLELALDGDDGTGNPDGWLQLAEARLGLLDLDGARSAARCAAEAFGKRPGGARRADAARLVAARADLRAFVAARQQELETGEKDRTGRVPPAPATRQLAETAIAAFDQAREAAPAEAVTQVALVYQWLGQDGRTTAELERGIRILPEETSIHRAYVDWMRTLGQQEALVGAYARFRREHPRTTLLRWYEGEALFLRADALRAEGNFRRAIATYEKAQAAFADYRADVPSHADSAAQWQALCELSIARTAVELGDLDAARDHLFAAEAVSPAAAAYADGKPQLADSFGSHYAGVVFAIHRALAEGGADALAKTLAFNEAVLERHPDRFGFVYNNAALAARDLGVQAARTGDAAVAKDLWERSYRHYEKAVVLSPDDARIVNDCGLMLIYHLDRDFGRARELFDRAIAVGQPQLDALPADADPRDRELLEEAVGDAWQNIAVLMRRHERASFGQYRPFCERAVRYFPYDRRYAARLLRTGGEADEDAPAPGAVAQGGAADALAKVRAAVDQKAAAADLDGALQELDAIAAACKEHAPYHALRGELTLRLATAARNAKRRGVEFLFQDAVQALQKAVTLDSEPVAPRLQLAQAQYDAGEIGAAAATASSLLLHLQSLGGGRPDEVAAVHTVRANAAARAYAADAQANDAAALLQDARSSFRALEQQGRLDAGMLATWSAVELTAGAPAEAVNVYARALQRSPDDQQLLAAVVDAAIAGRQAGVAVESLRERKDATGLWYLGRATFEQALASRDAGRRDEAQQALDAAREQFAASMRQNAEFRDSCEQWIAMCLGAKGLIAGAAEDFAGAERWLFESLRLRPDRAAEPIADGKSTKTGILLLVDHYYQAKDLARTEAICRAAADAAPGDLDLLNNAGLFARDRGNELEAAGNMKDAMEMYEQSYRAYGRAVQLDPQNVRLRNDVALIAIYHLERDWDLSKQRLEAAIADGEKALAEIPPEDRDAREKLDEAIGDCHENLALWHLKHSKDAAAAKAAAEASLRHHPRERRPGATRHLRAAERMQQAK